MKLKIKNFALFNKEVAFELAPLTLLIGANSSGKSTFLKAIDIAQKLEFDSDKFDLESVKDYVESGTTIKIEAFEDVFLNIKFKLYDFGYVNSGGVWGEVETVLEYLNSNDEVILSVEPKHGETLIIDDDKDFRDRIVKINTALFEEVLIRFLESRSYKLSDISKHAIDNLHPYDWNMEDGGSDKLRAKGYLFSLFNILDISKVHNELTEKNLKAYAYLKVQGESSPIDILFEELHLNIAKFLNCQFTSDDEEANIASQHEVIRRIFKPKKKSAGKKGKINIIRWDTLGKSKRIYKDEDSFYSVLNIYQHDNWEPGVGMIMKWFIDYWMNAFFGKDIDYEIIHHNDRHGRNIAYEFTLNKKDLVEWGTGAFRVIQFIFRMGNLLYEKIPMGDFDFKEYDKLHLDYVKKFIKSSQKVNQSLKFNSDKFSSLFEKDIYIIEEPEMNLHPDYQCSFAEMIYMISSLVDVHIVIETHSEFIIRTFQYLRAKEHDFNKEHLNIINFGNGDNLGKIKNITIDEDGSLSDSFFSGFMNHSQQLELKLLTQNRKISSN